MLVDGTMNCTLDEHGQRVLGNCSTPFPSLDGNLSYGITTNGNISDYEYDYHYDYSASINTFNLEELLPVALVYSLTLVLGILGNVLVIFSIVRYRRMQNVTNIFLTSLASADLLLVMLCVPIKVSSSPFSVLKGNDTSETVEFFETRLATIG